MVFLPWKTFQERIAKNLQSICPPFSKLVLDVHFFPNNLETNMIPPKQFQKLQRSWSTSHPPGEFDRIFMYFATKPWSIVQLNLQGILYAPLHHPPAIGVVRAEVERPDPPSGLICNLIHLRPARNAEWLVIFLCYIQLSCGSAFMKPLTWTWSGCFFLL